MVPNSRPNVIDSAPISNELRAPNIDRENRSKPLRSVPNIPTRSGPLPICFSGSANHAHAGGFSILSREPLTWVLHCVATAYWSQLCLM